MTRMLVIGLVWLSVSACTGVLIGYAIHRADLRDERFPKDAVPADDARMATAPRPARPRSGAGRGEQQLTGVPRPRAARHLVHRHPPSPPTDEGPARSAPPR